jgi:hypothetical protein
MAAKPRPSVRVVFDKERKLYARHEYMREAVRMSGKSITELMDDPFFGYAYVLWALLQPGAQGTSERIDLNKSSRLIDKFFDNGGTLRELNQHLSLAVESYLRIENTPTDEEEDAGGPNAESPDAPGPTAD